MSSFIDLSGTAHLPVVPELRDGAALLLACSSRAGESIRRAHTHWSVLAAAYAAPEQQQVHQALDGPRDAGQAVLESASLAAAALETFAAAVEDIRSRRLALERAAGELQEQERQDAGPVIPVSGVKTPVTLAGQLLQAEADQLTQDLAAAEERCIRTLDRLAGGRAADRNSPAGAEERPPIGQCMR